MTEHDNTNRGAVWVNEKRSTDKHPDFTGSLNVEGVEYWVSAWKKAKGDNPRAPVLSFSVKRKEQRAEPPKDFGATEPEKGGDDWTDDIPFAPVDWRAS